MPGKVLIRMEDDLHKAVKHFCIDRGLTLNKLFIDAITDKITDKPGKEITTEKEKPQVFLPARQSGSVAGQSRTIGGENPKCMLVDVVQIKPVNKRVSKSLINKLSESIEAIGLLRPLILLQTGVEEYEILQGNSEYLAARQAYEKNPQACHMVNAFIVSKKASSEAYNQIDLLKEIG